MIGVTLSRWTMSYFVTAIIALILGEALMVAGFGYPSADLMAPQTLVLVHLIAIGWMSILICGALIQFVPVLVARSIFSNDLPLPTLVLLVVGLAGLITGFLQLAGIVQFQPLLLPWGGALLILGFALLIYNLARTLWPARPLPVPARFVAVALICLAVAATLGFLFTLVLASLTDSGTLGFLVAEGVPLHVVAALGGWLTFTAMGVTYRLLAMFMLAPEGTGKTTLAAFWLGAGGLAVAVLGGLCLVCFERSPAPALLAGLVLGAVAFGFYIADMNTLYRTRRRPVIELNSRMAAFALGSLAGVVALMLVLLATGHLVDRIASVVFLATFGWLSGLGLAKLYKITAFLTWLESYGPVLGKMKTPRVQDLVIEPRARRWFLLYFASVWCATAALLVPQALLFRLCTAGMLVATAAIAVELLRIRRLSDVAGEQRLAEAVPQPHLMISVPAAKPSRP